MRGRGGCEGECRCGSNVKNEHRNDKAATEPMTRRYSDGKQKPEQRELTEDTVHPGYLVGGGVQGFTGTEKGGGRRRNGTAGGVAAVVWGHDTLEPERRRGERHRAGQQQLTCGAYGGTYTP
jgi:hypothetical protein